MLKAGTAIKDISPKLGVQLAGYPHCPRENTGIHDPIYATALFLDNGKEKVTIVSLDLLSIGKITVQELRKVVNHPVTFTCTHTHCAPWASEPLASEKEEGINCNEEYLSKLKEDLKGLILEAENNVFDAEIATCIGTCGIKQGVGGNRREKNGLQDTSVNVIAVREKGGDVKSIVVNYALHPTYLHAENTLVTADYPCYIRRYFHFAEPNAIVSFMQGTSGDQSSRYHRVGQNFEEACRAGTILAVEVDRCIKNAEYKSDVDLSFSSYQFDNLPLKTYPPVEVTEKAKIEAEAYYESVKDKDYITARNAELAMFGAQNNYYFSKMQGYKSPELPLEIALVKIDDTLIVMLQGEIFVEIGLKIKELSPYKKTFVYEVSNGYLPGYIYTEKAGIEGGYEVGTSTFELGADKVLIENVKEIFKNV